jgi:DNA-binding transcriptional LysR family regulator
MMLPDFNRLKIFHAIYACGSIVKAARQLHLTQSGVSQHLQKLELELQTPLFTRLHRRLIPTQAGQRLFGLIAPFIQRLGEELDVIRQEQELPSGLLRIGAPMEFGRLNFPGLFATFRAQHPRVRFHLTLGDPGRLLALLSSGELDFALVDLFLAHLQGSRTQAIYAIEPIIAEEVILACSATYYNAHIGGNHSFSHLIAQDFLAYRPRTATLRSWFRHHFDKTTVRIDPILIVDSFQAILSAIKRDMGLGITVSHAVWDEMQRGLLVPITTERPSIINQISLMRLQDKIPSLAEKAFLSYLRDHIRSSALDSTFTGRAVDQPRAGEPGTTEQ